MAIPEQITVRVGADGSITAETHGITGPKCLDYIAVLEDLLEATTLRSAFTADYQDATQIQTSPIADEVTHDLPQH